VIQIERGTGIPPVILDGLGSPSYFVARVSRP
jgi:hypothetical protein